jgi:hypothetical protein
MNAHGKLFGILVQIFKEAFLINIFRKYNVILIRAADHMIHATG